MSARRLAIGNHQAAADRELGDQRRGRRRGGRVDGDRVERRAVGQAGAPVPDHDLDVGDPEIAEGGPGPVGQLGHALDRDHLGGQPRQHRGRVAGARPDLQHPLAAPQLHRLADGGHDPRLGDRLLMADRQGRVGVVAPRDSGSGTKRSRGTAAIASSTRSSPMPRRRSCRSTMLRALGCELVGVGPAPHQKM